MAATITLAEPSMACATGLDGRTPVLAFPATNTDRTGNSFTGPEYNRHTKIFRAERPS